MFVVIVTSIFFSSNPALHGAFKVLCSNSLLRSFRGNTSGHNKVYLLLFKKKKLLLFLGFDVKTVSFMLQF